MRFRMSFAGSAVCLVWLAVPASSHTSQISKTWEIGRSLADQLDPFVRDVELKILLWNSWVIMYSGLKIGLLGQPG
jgi:hypothetical protein